MSVSAPTLKGALAPPWPCGFSSASVSAGIKSSGSLDLSLLRMPNGAAAAAMFTTNQFAAAPILASRRNLLDSHGRCFALLINSGCANAATGDAGLADAHAIIDAVAQTCGCSAATVLTNSTGIIGKRLPIDRVLHAIPSLAATCCEGSCGAFAHGIMTTDTHAKMASRTVHAESGGTIRVTGVAKGAGMIHPNMATMISVIATDADVQPRTLDEMLRHAVEYSFHRISIDGDTSTNDSVFALASGLAGKPNSLADLQRAIDEVADELSRMIVHDGEGFTRAIEVQVHGAASDKDALLLARTVATSTLVRCAITGGDPNWGRIVAAAGRSGAALDPDRLSVQAGGLPLFANGRPCEVDASAVKNAFAESKVIIELDVGLGTSSEFFLSSGLTESYVRLNSEYST